MGGLEGGGLALLLDNCSLKGFGTGNFFGPYWLWTVVVDSCWPLNGCC